MQPDEFWGSTPAETSVYLEGLLAQRRDFQELAVLTAWRIEAFARTKKLPDPQRLIQSGRRVAVPLPSQAKGMLGPEQQEAFAAEISKWRGFFATASRAKAS